MTTVRNSIKPITQCSVFVQYDKGLDLKGKMTKLAKEGKVITVNDLPREFSDIERIYYYPSKNIILNDISMKNVVPVFVKSNYVVPTTIPAFLNRDEKGVIRVIVNISNNATVDREGNYKIETKPLYCLLQAGTILGMCFTKHKKIQASAQVIKSGTIIYSKLFTKILNKLYALNTVPDKLEQAHFLAGMFFLVNVMGLDPSRDTTVKYALAPCKNPSVVPAAMLLGKLKAEDFKDIDSFIEALPEVMPIFKGLTTRVFLDNYIQSYSPGMLMALEYLPSFVHNISSVIVGGYMNNQFAIEQTCGKELDVFYKAFFSL